jgi:hypothetical protein
MLGTMYWTIARIKERGWTKKMLEECLGKPCKTNIKSQYNNKRNVKVWHMDRVLSMENYPEVAAMIDKNLKNKIIKGKIIVGERCEFTGACNRYLQRMKLPVPKTEEEMEELRITLSNM